MLIIGLGGIKYNTGDCAIGINYRWTSAGLSRGKKKLLQKFFLQKPSTWYLTIGVFY